MKSNLARCVVLAIALVTTELEAQARLTVGVFPLDFTTVKAEAASIYKTSDDAGKGIAELIANGLVRGNRYDVMEKTQLDKVLNEQTQQRFSNRFDTSTAAEFGRLIGVRIVVMGSVTKLGRESSNTVGIKRESAIVGLTVRMVDSTSGRILLPATGNGEARSGFKVSITKRGGPGDSPITYGGGFKDAVVQQAVEKAVEQVVEQFNAAAERLSRELPLPSANPQGASKTPNPTPAPEEKSAAPAAQKASDPPLTIDSIVEMMKAGVPDDQIAEIVLKHETLAFKPTDPTWAIAVARQKVPLKVQNAVRQRAGLPAIAPAVKPAPSKPAPAK